MRYLGRDIVKMQCLDQADDSLSYFAGDGHQVWVGERWQIGETVKAPAESFQDAGVPVIY